MQHDANTIHDDYELLKGAILVEDFYSRFIGHPIRGLGPGLVYLCPFDDSCGASLFVNLTATQNGYAQCAICGRFGGFMAIYKNVYPFKSFQEGVYDLASVYNRNLLPFWGIN